MKVLFNTKFKGKGKPSNVGLVEGDDKDLYISFEGGIPIKLRELLGFWYDQTRKASDGWYLTLVERRRTRRIQKQLEEMQLQN